MSGQGESSPASCKARLSEVSSLKSFGLPICGRLGEMRGTNEREIG